MNREGAKIAKKTSNAMGFGESTSPELEEIARTVVDAIYTVHRNLGPGLLESVYSICLAHELRKRGLKVEREVKLPILYDDVRLEAGFRLDLVVVNPVSSSRQRPSEKLIPVFDAQLLIYLKLTGFTLGFLVNFNVTLNQGRYKSASFCPKTQKHEPYVTFPQHFFASFVPSR